MNGRVIATGEIKVFYPTRECGYDGYVDKDGKFYYPKELDFRNNGIPVMETELVIPSVWIARDEDGSLTAFSTKPYRCRRKPFASDYWRGDYFRGLDKMSFPDITWQSEPVEFQVVFRKK